MFDTHRVPKVFGGQPVYDGIIPVIPPFKAAEASEFCADCHDISAVYCRPFNPSFLIGQLS